MVKYECGKCKNILVEFSKDENDESVVKLENTIRLQNNGVIDLKNKTITNFSMECPKCKTTTYFIKM